MVKKERVMIGKEKIKQKNLKKYENVSRLSDKNINIQKKSVLIPSRIHHMHFLLFSFLLLILFSTKEPYVVTFSLLFAIFPPSFPFLTFCKWLYTLTGFHLSPSQMRVSSNMANYLNRRWQTFSARVR